MEFKEPLVTATISGLLLFVIMSAYNKVTNDPEEVMTLGHMVKMSIINTIIIFLVICSNTDTSKPSENILTKFDD